MRPRPTPNFARNATRSRRGFTLLELIISVALVLVLMLAITKIFSITSTTIGASQAFVAATRDARGAQAVFAHDIGSMASDSPFIWIRCDAPIAAFRNAADAAGDVDYVPGTQTATGYQTTGANSQAAAKRTIDIDGTDANTDGNAEGDSNIPGEIIGDLDVNNRSHRQDRFSFCARDRFYRQTGNTTPNTIVAGQSSPEAWITYGHLTLPNSSGQFFLTSSTGGTTANLTNPGDGTEQNNSQNFYASQWALGRVAMLLVDPTINGAGVASIVDASGTSQEYYARNGGLTPLTSATKATVQSGGQDILLSSNRYDLVGASISTLGNVIDTYNNLAAAGTSPTWFGAGSMLDFRFRANPFVIKPIDATNASQQVPTFIPACSQFIVEYAGDFVTQNANGSLDTTAAMGGLTPDGQVDFHYDAATGSRQIQWFGYPRSPTGNLTISFASGDVGLLGDFAYYISGSAAAYNSYAKLNAAGMNPDFASFEKFDGATNTKTAADTAKAAYPLKASYAGAIGTVYAAWAPDSINNPKIPRPKMYRITLTIDRPEMSGRTESGQTFEYVFNAP